MTSDRLAAFVCEFAKRPGSAFCLEHTTTPTSDSLVGARAVPSPRAHEAAERLPQPSGGG